MLTHRQLRYFVQIVDAGSFSAAAERLFVAQSALSRQVKDIESLLGVPVLERGARQVRMTPAGRSLHASATRILAALDDAAAQARNAQRGVDGTVRLLHSSSVPLTRTVQEVLRGHLARHPGLSLDLAVAPSEQQALDIEEGRADIGLARAPLLRRYPRVRYAALPAEPLVVVMAEHHSLAQNGTVRVAALRHEPFVAVPHRERGGLSHAVAELCRAHGFEPVPARARSRKWTQLTLVQAGFGIAIVPLSMARLAPPGVCHCVLETDGGAAPVASVQLLWPDICEPRVQRLADELLAALKAPCLAAAS